MPEVKTILIIASSGGGGLIQAANAKEQQLRLQYPHARIVRIDLLKDWAGKWGGRLFVTMWNAAQKSGSVRILKFFCIGIAISDFYFAPYVFFNMLKTVVREDVDYIIDTQPSCTRWIIKALRWVHRKRKKKIILEKVLVDLPTPKAQHYFRSIRKLSIVDRSYLKITTIPPYLQPGETAEQFWKTHCQLPEAQIQYEPFYVRQSFVRYHQKPRFLEPFSIKAKMNNLEDLQSVKSAIARGPIQAHWQGSQVELIIQPQDYVFTVLLGSQPAYEGSLNYVRYFLELARECRDLGIVSHLFVFCADHNPCQKKRGLQRLVSSSLQKSLLKSVSELVQQAANYPDSASVIPLSFQTDEVIAPIFYRSDATCTRSGGQTLMELMCVAPKHIWIHSEAKKKEGITQKDLLEGIAGWEAANALYMQEMYDAKIVTPHSFKEHIREIFHSEARNSILRNG